MKEKTMTIEIHNCKTDQSRIVSFTVAFNFWMKECRRNVYPKEELDYIKSDFEAAVSSQWGASYFPYTISKVYEGPVVNPSANTRWLN